MVSKHWTIARAKAKFSELIESAEKRGPQFITRNHKRTAVVISIAEWQRKSQRTESLADFFAISPLRGSGLRIGRAKSKMRKVELRAVQ